MAQLSCKFCTREVVTHSHQMGTGLLTKGLRPFMTKDTEHDFGARNFSIMGIELASEVSKELKVSAEAKCLHMADQDFVLFHGRAWHGTVFPKNESGERRVFLLQYATPSCQIRAPDAADRAENSPVMPITMMVSGTAQGWGGVCCLSFCSMLEFPDLAPLAHSQAMKPTRTTL